MTEPRGFSRRYFLKGVGAGALASGALPALGRGAPGTDPKAAVLGPGAVRITLEVNGERRELEVEPRVTLLDALRNHLDLTGSKKVCDRATCGACTVLLDGKAVYACTMLAVAARGHSVETVESLGGAGRLAPIQEAFVRHDAQQCGFCTPGFVVACASFLRQNPAPDRAAVDAGLGGNLCRCGTYMGIRAAVLDAAKGGK